MKNATKWIDHLNTKCKSLEDFLVTEYGANAKQLWSGKNNSHFIAPQVNSLKELRVAAIMDRFTLDSYEPECNLLELTPDNWKEEIESFQPQLIFIESAWNGKDDLWNRKISHISPEYYQMTEYCHDNRIPVIFWNKEDPVHIDEFITTAQCADFVFTTDIDCIEIYKNALEKDAVYFLPFAAQPTICNPIEKYIRKDKFCFAGGYYRRYTERSQVFDAFSDVLIELKGIDIYDRNYGHARPEHAFPERYDPYILGSLDHNDIDIAYKGYIYGINMNSVQQSQTMFARRVFEMLASNTVTVGNFSRGLKNMLGELTICTDDAQTLRKELELRCKDDETMRKYRLLGLRKVLSEHLYEDRLDYIVQKVFGISLKRQLPLITCIASPEQEDLAYILETFHCQTYLNKHLLLIGNYSDISDEEIMQISWDQAENIKLNDILSDGYFGILLANNYYGINYLTDLALTFRYIDSCGVGKTAYYVYNNDLFEPQNIDTAYHFVSALKIDRSIFSTNKYAQLPLLSLLETDSLIGDDFFSIDEFNFCQGYKAENCSTVDDMTLNDKGISLANIENIASNIKVDFNTKSGHTVSWEDMLPTCQAFNRPLVEIVSFNERIRITSAIENHDPQYIWLPQFYELKDLQKDGQISVQLIANGDLNMIGSVIFYNAQKQRTGAPAFPHPNIFYRYEIPEDAAFIKLALRFEANGTCDIKKFILGADKETQGLSCFLSRSNILILTVNYPSPNDLYHNMFIHQRITAYLEKGYLCDVMQMYPSAKDHFSEFEGINIVKGNAERLRLILENGQIDTVCIHFFNKAMWDVLKEFKHKLRIIIWIHGVEIQPWYRRNYNYTTLDEIQQAEQASKQREMFWKEIFAEANICDMHFVFVSNSFAQEVFEDYHLRLPNNRYSIIHNCIDNMTFSYHKKPADQRKKILSIRPYAGRKYANDLTVKCIQELSQRDFFDDLEFLIMGDGNDFWQINEPLKDFSNITLENRFLRHDEIAELHKEYGIFLVPSRADTQGVSCDEAMSSGLVSITNAVTAIPEFVDDTCSILVPGEDYLAMADGIERLYYDPELFEKMSENAAKHIRELSSKEQTIDQEIALIWHTVDS